MSAREIYEQAIVGCDHDHKAVRYHSMAVAALMACGWSWGEAWSMVGARLRMIRGD